MDLVPTVSYKLPVLNFTNNWWDDKASGKLFNNGHTGDLFIIIPFIQLFIKCLF